MLEKANPCHFGKNSENLLYKFNNDIKNKEFNSVSKDEYVNYHQNILNRESNSTKEKINEITFKNELLEKE